jgi:uncharacterized tellurite resistance protein B-like protein
MFDSIANLFRQETAPAAIIPGPLALAAILVEAARRDGDYAEAERAAILRIIRREEGLDEAGGRALLAEAETAQENAVDLFRFTHALKESTPFEERIAIIEDLWDVILSDGARDHSEDGLVRSVCGLLGIPDRESGLARARVMSRTG